MTSFVEIIIYRLKSGTGSAFHQIMLSESIPLQRGAGINVVDSRQSATDPDCYCLIRAFDDLAGVNDIQESFYASAAWREGPRERIVALIENASKIVLEMSKDHVSAWTSEHGF